MSDVETELEYMPTKNGFMAVLSTFYCPYGDMTVMRLLPIWGWR